ncbi:hypothetical protein FACS1894152_8640 [Bacilli bacterium]|nr:hypothetical protein FACS1894152_8640 [Bacilli bacterium]
MNNDRLLKSLTGVSRVEFETILPTFEKLLLEDLKSRKHIREIGGGRIGILTDGTQKLFYIL